MEPLKNRFPIQREPQKPIQQTSVIENNSNLSEVDILKTEINKLKVENKHLIDKNAVLLEDLETKYDDFDWSVIWQDEEKSTFPIGSVILGVLQVITMIIILIRH